MCSMRLSSKRFTGLIVVIISVLLALTASGFFYYIQINENESYQNQLHFRELNEVSRALNDGLKQLATVAKEDAVTVLINQHTKKIADKISQHIHPKLIHLNSLIAEVNRDSEKIIEKTIVLEQQQQSTLNSTHPEQITFEKSSGKSLIQIERELEENLTLITQKQKALRAAEYQHSDYLDNLMEQLNSYDEQDVDYIGEQCEIKPNFCQWFEDLFASYLEVEPYRELETANLDSAIQKNYQVINDKANTLANELKDEQSIIREISALLKKSILQLSQQPNLVSSLHCDNSVIWQTPLSCQRLSLLLTEQPRQQLSQQHSLPAVATQTKKNSPTQRPSYIISNDINLLKQEINYSKQINSLKREILQYFRMRLKLPTMQTEVTASIKKIKNLASDIDNIMLKNETLFQKKADEILKYDKTLSNLNQSVSQELSRTRSEIANKQQEIVTLKQKLTSALEQYNDELFPYERSVSKETKDFQVFYDNLKLAFSQLRNCIIDHTTANIIDCSNDFKDLGELTKPQSLQELLQSSTYLKNAQITTENLVSFSTKHNLSENKFNLFSVPEEQHSQVAYFFQNNDKKNQRSLTTVPMVDLLGNNIARFPLILIVDKQGKRLVRKENSLLGSFQHGLNFDLTTQILKKMAHSQNAEDSFFQTSGQQVTTNTQALKSTSELTENNEKNEIKSTIHGETLPGYSGYIDVSISGQDYRVFISPYQASFFDAQNNQNIETLYLMGFVAKSALVSKKLSISNSAVLISIVCLLILMALVPLLKIRLISTQQSFSLADRHWAFIGLGVLTGILAIAIFDQAFYQHLKNEIDQQSKVIHQEIKHNFKHEINALSTYALQNVNKLKTTSTNGLFSDPSLSKNGSQYFLENLFTLQADGIFKGSALWSSEQFYRKKAIDLNIRAYFNQAIRCNAWPIDNSANADQATAATEDNNCQQQLYMQRIFNVRDSRKTTQISKPLFTELTEKDLNNTADDQHLASNKTIMAYGTRIQSFFAPLLPKHFGFLVFDNASGDVLYHSDDERSLLENIYIETDNNPKLLKLVANAKLSNEESAFTSPYRGETHHFRVGRLAKNIPWTLAVFYEKSQLRTLNMLTVFTAITCFILLSLLTYLVIMLFTRKNFLQQLFWFNDKIQTRYQGFAIQLLVVSVIQISFYMLLEKFFPQLHSLVVLALMLVFSLLVIFNLHRQLIATDIAENSTQHAFNTFLQQGSKGYNAYLLMLYIYCFATPAILLCMSSAGYYLEKHAVIHAIHLNQHQQIASDKHQKYYNLVLDNDVAFKLDANKLPCYLGISTNVGSNSSAIRCDNKSLTNKEFWFGKLITAENKPLNNNNIFDLIWHVVPLNFPFAQETWLLSSLAETKFEWSLQFASKHNRILLNALWANLYWSAFLVLLAIAWLHSLIKEWLSKRLIGSNVPANFRLNDSAKQLTDEKVKLLFKHLAINDPNNHRGCFIQIIRPTSQLFKHFSDDTENKYQSEVKKLFLTTNNAIAISQLTDSTQNIEHHIKHLLKIDGNTVGKTVILKKLEMTALDRQQRLRALEVLQYIIELGNVNIILLADITPLYRLTKQAAYPNDLARSDYANSDETVRWARLMKRFVKFYDWTPQTRLASKSSATSEQVLTDEAMSWPECQRLEQDFYDYHLATKTADITCIHNKYYDLNGAEIKATHLKQLLSHSINQHWSSEQVIEFFNANSGASYRYRWELCTKAERLLLIQLANGYSPNPLNLEPLEHLIRRGYIFQDNGWHIINNSFKRFVLSAENDVVVSSWIAEAMQSNWQYVRIPLFTLVLVALGLIAYSASEAVESLMAIMTGVLSITPLLLRSFSLFKGASGADSS